ncbi:MAG: SRPBCC domain-containing protein [Methanospirillum sp.]
MDVPFPARRGSLPGSRAASGIGETMTDGNGSRAAMAGERLEITRVFDAPPERVFRAWTDAERVKCWWGPKGYTAPFARIDPRAGGRYLYAMRSPEGQDFWSTGVYRELVEPERIVATDSFSDAEGNVIPASQYGMTGDWPLELVATFTFEEENGKTKLTLRHEGFPDRENRDMARAGWNESFDKLDACLAKQS